ncbi:ankyrin 1 [Fusarium mundagurra]|uniref:Ankyrin 1 n=1 Tax=Fusarium mundagurra TaxID=1567541 RepID=A0A8H5YJL3_9HYPO|nr:ankyrin 1 [Fusarium mundagurra]
MATSQSHDQDDEPLLVFETPLEHQVIGEDDTVRTENASMSDWERRNIIQRTSGSIHTRVELLSVSHGSYNEGGDKATLMIFRFRFDPQKSSRRVIRARVEIEFFATDDSYLEVDAIAPEERWTVLPTIDTETTTRSGQLNLGASGVPFLDAGATASLERSYSRDVSGATTITGSINIGTGKNSGESTVAVWNLQENERRKTGVPDSVTTAILVRRAGDERFNAEVTLQADVDWVTGWERRLSKIPLDDPILFNPRETGGPGKKGRSYGVKDLASVDLNGLCKRTGDTRFVFLANSLISTSSVGDSASVVTMVEIVVPETEKPVLEVQTAVDENHDRQSQKFGLNVIQDGEQEPIPNDASNHETPVVPFDVVLIHGIYGSSPDSWTTGSDTIWINKALAGASENKGRMMSYGYHTDIERGRYYTPCGVYQEAEALLEALRKLRTSEITVTRRPIHFFSHDVGGTIVKAALAMATDDQDKYGDILHCTRAMYFFGYPHRYSSIGLLEEAVLRLTTQQQQKWSGHMVAYAKSLTRTIIKVNDAFLGTQMLTQANFINVVSNLHLDPAQQVFTLCMSTMATPFERVVKMEKSNRDLILAGEDGSHPVYDIADADWLMGGLTDEQHIALHKIISQASPVQPYQRIDEEWQNSDLLELPKRKETLIIHMRCSSGAEAASENASFFLDKNRSGTFHPLLYMKFDARDTRFNNCDAMMRTFLARIVCSRLHTAKSVVSRSMDDLLRSGALHRTSLSGELETLRSINDMKSAIYVLGCFDECDESSIWFLSAIHELLLRKEQRIKILVVTTKGTHGDRLIASALSRFPPEYARSIDYHPEEPRPFPVDTEASKLTNKLGESVGTCLHRDVHLVLSSCASDHNLCELVIEWLGAGTGQITRTARLLDKPLTPSIVFAAILEDVEESHRPWAKILLSWLLACYRPLRYDELRHVSNIVWLQLEGNKPPVSAPTDILRSFHGLLTSVNGEIHFKHPDTRAWLESCHLAGDGDLWYETIETSYHEKVLQTSIDYIQHAARNSQGSVLSLPYAIEFWHKHWQRVKTSKKHVQDLFCNESVFQFWANSLFALPNAQFKPPPKHIKPLAVAAHLGLTTVIEMLLEKRQDQAELRGQALIEACRTGQVATIRLLIRSYADGLDFDDEHLVEAAKTVSHSSNDEALAELISAIPELPKTDPGVEESEVSLEFTEIQEKTSSQDDSSKRSTKHDREVKDLHPQKRVSSPLDWLVMPMYKAAKSGLSGAVTRLLQLGVSPNPPKGITPYDNSYIHAAAVHNHVTTAKLLIDAGASPTAVDNQGYTPLQKAIWWASGETVEFLLSNGASINDQGKENLTTTGATAMWGSFAALEVILSRKDEVEHLMDDSDWNPVIRAVEYENKKCLKLLLSHGFSPNIVSSKGETALRLAIQNKRLDFCKMLLESNADPDLAPDKVNTPLIQAISEGDLDIVKLLIENKATVDKREAPPDDGWSRTPLQVAVDWNRPEIVQYLLEKGPDPDARDSDGIPVIGAAVSGGHINMVQWLVDAKADVNAAYHENKLTPLHEACPHPEVVRLLLEHGADINKANADSRTALNFAIVANNLITVQVLLDSKTKPDINADTIYWDLRMVIASGYIEIVEKMLEAGVDVNNVNENGESLLAYAIKCNAPSGMISKILEYNPDLEMRDKKENTALHCITRSTTLETVRLVVNAGGRLDVLNSDKDTPLIVAIGAQMDDVFFYMLNREPSLLTQNFITSQQRVTPLHEACRFGSLTMVRSLIDHGMDINSSCEGFYGTPLISATLRSDLLSSPLASDIIALLLVNGASPSTKGGLFRYPLISACLSCPADTVRLLLNSDSSPEDGDSLWRRAVHLACYNSLAVLNLLEVPDSEFAVTDVVGRVPLHYSVMTGDVELVEVVLERSERVGVGIDVKDDDGWTPLLWAARAARIWNRQIETGCSSSDMISFLLRRGADPTIKGHGVDRDWTVCEVAYYHHADLNADKIHPEHSSFVRCGSEWVEDEVAKDEDVQEISLDTGMGDQDVLLDLEEIPYEDFDSEVSE